MLMAWILLSLTPSVPIIHRSWHIFYTTSRHLALVRPCIGVHGRTPLTSLSLVHHHILFIVHGSFGK